MRVPQPDAAAAGRGRLARLFQQDLLILDTETTGLSGHSEVIEVGVIDRGGHTVLESLVRPKSGFVPRGARAIHGLGMAHLKDAPSWPEVLPELLRVLGSRPVLAWNAGFDQRMLEQSSDHWGLSVKLPRLGCAMRSYANARGLKGGRCGLARAATLEGVLGAGQSHRSIGDARLTLSVLRAALAPPDGVFGRAR